MVAKNSYAIQCSTCRSWFHRKCAGLTLAEIKSLPSQTNWLCGCQLKDSTPIATPDAKVFGRYVDDILRSAKVSNIERILEVSNNLHPNLEFTIETLKDNAMPFLDMEVRLLNGKIDTSWYQKPADTGLILQFRALAPVKYKKNIIEGTIYRIFNATSTWENFTEGIKRAAETWEKNQYPPQFYQPILRQTLDKILKGKTISHSERSTCERGKNMPLILQYRGDKSDQFAKKLRRTVEVSTIFTTRKLKTALPSLKSPIPKMLLSNVVYQITCPGCQSSYVGQTTRHLTTRIQEHARPASHVGSHLSNCSQTMQDAEINVSDRTNSNIKLLTLEALHISRRAPSINQKEEYRTRELTLSVIYHCSNIFFGLIKLSSVYLSYQFQLFFFFHLMVLFI